ncbi:hypothetical protein [Treponema zioleckii]|uniref:hypothetical protein n=1 Tax=Treponema zioleckii TaxID=331680 RepID=UPI00168AA6B3|nr:hypothetical protein [Treponema zioleckii]
MTINNTFSMFVDDPYGEADQYCFNLRNCMYMARNTPMCLRFIFGTHNLVMHFKTLDAVSKYYDLFTEYFEKKIESIEIDDADVENCEIEVKE